MVSSESPSWGPGSMGRWEVPRRREGANGQEVKSKDFTRERNMVAGGREGGRKRGREGAREKED